MNSPVQFYLDALLNNDEKVLKQLYLEVIPSVVSYVIKNSGNEADARDIFQDAILAVFQKAQLGQLQIKTGFQPYFFAVCRNLWLMQLRKRFQKRVTSIDEQQPIDGIDSFGEAELVSRQYARQQLLEEKLQHIGESCLSLLRLVWSGKPLEEVANLLNISYAYIRKKKSECITKLMALVKNTLEYEQLKT